MQKRSSKPLSEQRARVVARELLKFREWDLRAPSKAGQLLEEAEYRHHPVLKALFASHCGASVRRPDFLLVESALSLRPLVVVETKAAAAEVEAAVGQAISYAQACVAAGHDVLAVGVAGADQEICAVRVRRFVRGAWVALTLNGAPIDWIPSARQVKAILAGPHTEVAPERPSDEALTAQANRLNEILRECKIKDEFRPIYAATFMLALWRGDVATDASVVLTQINANAYQALQKADKGVLANSLRVDHENDQLAQRAWEIIDILKKLNIRSFLREHDYLGQLYETFFRYTGANTIGQYFTPRHIIETMCELVEVSPSDRVLDPACGTGGFLIGALNRMAKQRHLPYDEAVQLLKDQLFGIESEPGTAALCVTNMILRGDGRSGVIKDNCFTNTQYPREPVDRALMNPPFPHSKSDTPTTDFIDRALLSLRPHGLLATIVPYSLLVRIGPWHQRLLERNTLLLVATLPPDLFNPYASFNTAVLIIEQGVPQAGKPVFFAKISNDGCRLKKNARVPQPGSQLPQLIHSYRQRLAIAEFSAVKSIDAQTLEWSPEAFIENAPHRDAEFVHGFEESIREQAAFYLRYGSRLLGQAGGAHHGIAAAARAFAAGSCVSLNGATFAPFKVSEYFEIELGGVDEIEDLEEGTCPIVSTSEFQNGVTAWRKPNRVYAPGAITVATDGSTCSSFVQEFAFYAFYKVAVLRPKAGVEIPLDARYFMAYLLRRERWRYVYARKFGKARIASTMLYGPSKNGRPDFQAMAQLAQQTAAFPVIQAFREALAAAGPSMAPR